MDQSNNAGVTWPHWVNSYKHINSLWPSDTIWRHKSGSKLARVMACCLMAPNHYLNLLYPLLNKVEGVILVSPCPSVHPSVYRILSALYLLQYSPDPFHIYTSYQATSEGVLHVKFFFFKIQKYELANNMGNHGAVSSERRRSSCSSFDLSVQPSDIHLRAIPGHTPAINHY